MNLRRHPASSFAAIFFHAAILVAALTLASFPARGQNDPVERTFTETRPEVENAVATAKASFSGKLPALEGFVAQTQQPIERYERAYYQCLFQVIPSASGETSVRVTAKITAWYDDPDKRQSGYQILPSNGRLENDALDRVQEILEGPASGATKTSAAAPKYNLSLGSAIPGVPGSRSNAISSNAATARLSAAGASTAVTEEEIEGLRAKRAAAERRVQQLNNALKNLQELYDSQTKPSNIVAVKNNGAPLYPRPEDGLKLLFAAVAKDQFEMIESRGDWVHVQISGESRGWIRKSQLEFPEDSSPTGASSAAKPVALFRITRQETGPFPGTWEPLRGKAVKIYSVQPSQSATAETSPQQKLAFVKELLLRAWKEHAADDPSTTGVVVVFDSADGGLASVTWPLLEQWQSGKISESQFWKQSFLDPPDAFAPAANKR